MWTCYKHTFLSIFKYFHHHFLLKCLWELACEWGVPLTAIASDHDMCYFHFSPVTARMKSTLKSCQLLCPQWSLMTAWGTKLWFSRAVTPSSACGQTGPSMPGRKEPAWMSRSGSNWQRAAHTRTPGRLWFNSRWPARHQPSKTKMRWDTHEKYHALNFNYHRRGFLSLLSLFLQWSGDMESPESGQNSLGFRETREQGDWCGEKQTLQSDRITRPHGGWRVSPQPKAVIGKHLAPIDTPGVHGAYVLFKSSQRSGEE